MSQALIDIGIRRGRLLERIAHQRAALNRDVQPVCDVLQSVDHGIARVRTVTAFLKSHPGLVLAAVTLLVVLKPRRAWRLAKRGFLAWRLWQTLREQFVRIEQRFLS